MKFKILITTLMAISLASAGQHAATSSQYCATQAPNQYYPDYGTCSNDADMQTCFNYFGTLSAQPGESVRNYCIDTTQNFEDDISITIESRFKSKTQTSDGLNSGNGENLKASFEDAPNNIDGYCVQNDAEFPFSSNQSECANGSHEDIIWKYQIKWSDDQDSNYDFQLGLDFGLGTAVQLDGFWVYTTNDDIWWGGNGDWNNQDVINVSQTLTAGPHTLTVYGQEGCCDGLQNITFRRNSNGPYANITKDNLKSALAGQYQNGYTHNGIEVYFHEFTIDYVNGFLFDPFCATQEVDINGIKIIEGDFDINQWSLAPGGEESYFKLKHADLVPVFGCSYYENTDAFRWQCPLTVTFFFGKNAQYIYNFHLKVFLSREAGATTEVTVTPNEVEGDCCTNELNIETALTLVTDLSGQTELARDNTNTYTTVRMTDLYIKHSITTQEFDYLYLTYSEIKIGPFNPQLLGANYEPGYTVYRVENFIAGAFQDISVISILDDTAQSDWNTRRRLQGDIGDNYSVKAEGQVTFTEEEDNIVVQGQQEKTEDSSDLPMAIGVSSAVGLVLGGLIGAGIIYALFLRRSVKGNMKNKSDPNNYMSSNVESQPESVMNTNQIQSEH